MANIIKLGSLLLDGAHTEPGSGYQPGKVIGFNNGNDLQWVVVNSMLISAWPLLNKISWDDLNEQDLVFGKRISIKGQQFLCRLLKVGENRGVPSEWDAALDVVGESPELWHWEPVSFWGQETAASNESYRAYRGFHFARDWYCDSHIHRSQFLGFRPVLVPLPSDDLIPGSEVCAVSGQNVLRGKLLDLTDYDAIIKPDQSSMFANDDEGKTRFKLPDGTVILDRSHISVQTIREN